MHFERILKKNIEKKILKKNRNHQGLNSRPPAHKSGLLPLSHTVINIDSAKIKGLMMQGNNEIFIFHHQMSAL
jgi:hypothetical protein